MFENALTELNKVQAPSLLLEDYNYFINKAVNQFINKTYNAYDMNQQKSDDVRVLKATAILQPTKQEVYDSSLQGIGVDLIGRSHLFANTYEVDLPDDYLHILNCIVEYDVQKTFKCYDKGSRFAVGASRLTADMYSQIINNYYMRPSYKKPYFYINNVNTKNDYPTQDSQEDVQYPDRDNSSEGIKENVERPQEERFGNKSKARMEIRYGKDDTVFKLDVVHVDYLKAPQFIRLTQDEVDKVEDTSQVLEFPDYVCQEILNELVMLLLENASDPRLQTNIPISQSIANPAQEQEQRR